MLSRCIRHIIVTTLLLLTVVHVHALSAAWHGDSVRVSLVTFYPGSDVYELYGHSEIRVTSPDLGDVYFNYGVFDFDAPNFIWRFVTGQTDYWCVAVPPAMVVQDHENRKLVEQELNLSRAEGERLSNLLQENARPGNNTYRYKYFSNNCATRPRDMIERALGQAIVYDGKDDSQLKPLTYRTVMRHYATNYPWEQFGIDLLLGSACDTLISWRQAMFVPMILRHAAARTRLSSGEPLVRSENILVDGDEQGNILPPTPWYQSPMAVMILVLAIVLAATAIDYKKRRTTRLLDFTLFTMAGLMGCVIAFLILFSTHEAVSPNFNILWLNPLQLAIAGITWVKRWRPALRWLHGINLALTGAVWIVWLAGVQVPDLAYIPLSVALAARSLYNSWRKL